MVRSSGLGSSKDDSPGVASENFRRAESNMSSKAPEQPEDNMEKVAENEEAAGGFYTGSGKDSSGGKRKKSFIRRVGPMALVFTFLFGGIGGVSFLSQLMLPFSLAEQLRDTFDSISVSTRLRSDVIWSKQIAQESLIKNPIRRNLYQRFFGFGEGSFKIQPKQRSRLAAQGIYVDDDFGGTGRTALIFDDGSGKLKVVAASDTDAIAFKNLDPSSIDLSRLDLDPSISRMEIDVDSSVSFRTAYTEVPDFRNGFISGSRTWRGSVSAWFDAITVKFLQSNAITRNMFKDFQRRVQAEQDGNTRSASRKVVADSMDASAPKDYDVTARGHDYEVTEYQTDGEGNIKYDDNHNPIPKNYVETDTNTEVRINNKGATRAEVRAKLNELKSGKLGAASKASGIATAVTNVVCTVFDVIGAINLLIAAKEAVDVITVVAGYLEAVDKVKAGDGDDSPIHTLSDGLTNPSPTTVFENTDNGWDALSSDDGVELREVVAEGKENTSAMQSAGIVSLYGGGAIDYNDASVQNFNMGPRFSTILDTITQKLGTAISSFAACAIAKLAAAAVDMVVDIITIVACIASVGIGCIVEKLTEAGTTAATSVAIGLFASAAVNIIMPLAVKAFTRDLVSNLFGEDYGNALVSGANVYMGNNHLRGGGSLSSFSKYVAYKSEQDAVIAEKARYERETKSPFDITSQYTFVGSLFRNVATMYTAHSSVTGIFGSTLKMLSNSVVSILPSASAYDLATTVKSEDDPQYSNNCPFLAQIGAVGDAYCNPYMVTDVSTINMDPIDVVDYAADRGAFDDEGNIQKGSNLARYITYCARRGSSFGIADSNIASDFAIADVHTGSSTADTVVNGALSAVPVAGDILDMVNNGDQLKNTGWIIGQSCVASGNPLATGSEGTSIGISWSENMYYQRFVEDQRLMETLNPDYESPVTAFLKEYDEEHPMGDTYEEVLAYKTGLSVENIVAAVDYIDYWNYINEYDASTRYAFGAPVVEERHELQFDNENQVAEYVHIVLLNEISFADVRNRVAFV